ncbi:ATP-binding cassette domain-containing protein [Microtetraspora sp. NBRC 16547]|uniref:ABC transporter ATP-binding protein n=1 Tax=Microtetraspora sp. NBRC 16547 TaxID=3030993 RepID=UPI0024A52640|nr:ATP-binding cassette domain-containing protein [Microtetraspora sp. NBRC 16547]GLX02831.1 ABC transporter ATP-binding protein [Microtetraspora sp. NBRC 16547]
MRVSNMSFRYRRRDPWVLSDVELTFAPGDVTEIVGRNGAGKSTLLRLLAGLLTPVDGTISGRPPVVGYAPERFPAEQPFTVAGYLRRMADIRRADPREVETWAGRLGMEHLLGHRLPDLSKGSAHKVGLVQALLCGPGLLILDEPFAGLDAATRAELPVIIGEVAERGGMVVVSDHQGDLRGIPGLRRVEVGGTTARDLGRVDEGVDEGKGKGADETAGPDDPGTADPGEAEAVTLLEVTVAVSRARELADRLRGEGHTVRVSEAEVAK